MYHGKYWDVKNSNALFFFFLHVYHGKYWDVKNSNALFFFFLHVYHGKYWDVKNSSTLFLNQEGLGSESGKTPSLFAEH